MGLPNEGRENRPQEWQEYVSSSYGSLFKNAQRYRKGLICTVDVGHETQESIMRMRAVPCAAPATQRVTSLDPLDPTPPVQRRGITLPIQCGELQVKDVKRSTTKQSYVMAPGPQQHCFILLRGVLHASRRPEAPCKKERDSLGPGMSM